MWKLFPKGHRKNGKMERNKMREGENILWILKIGLPLVIGEVSALSYPSKEYFKTFLEKKDVLSLISMNLQLFKGSIVLILRQYIACPIVTSSHNCWSLSRITLQPAAIHFWEETPFLSKDSGLFLLMQPPDTVYELKTAHQESDEQLFHVALSQISDSVKGQSREGDNCFEAGPCFLGGSHLSQTWLESINSQKFQPDRHRAKAAASSADYWTERCYCSRQISVQKPSACIYPEPQWNSLDVVILPPTLCCNLCCCSPQEFQMGVISLRQSLGKLVERP